VEDAAQLLEPEVLHTAAEVLVRPSVIPPAPGVYAWYFAELPPRVFTDGCHRYRSMPLLYVGIAPKAPPRDGRPGSRQTVRKRLQYHFRGNAAGSTLRLTLGCLLAEELGIGLRRVGSGNRFTFSDGEKLLSAWMAENTRVAYTVTERPWELEERLIKELALPLNLDQNKHSPFHQTLSDLRATQRASARALPVVAN
jgi:hypothetical protein